MSSTRPIVSALLHSPSSLLKRLGRCVVASSFVFGVVACKADKTENAVAPSGKTPAVLASCEAMADHRLDACPGGGVDRLFQIDDCERMRAEYEPVGCAKELAAFVLCMTNEKIDCANEDQTECEPQLDAVGACASASAREVGCGRSASRDDDCPQGQRPYAFACFAESPTSCQPIAGLPFSCCPALGNNEADYFVDPVLSPDELPPDYSNVNFNDPAACLAFGDKQGWGTCNESAACACQHCSSELGACASEYGCLFNRSCDFEGSCDPNGDPYFRGYSDGAEQHQALLACMGAHGCAETCGAGAR